MNLNVPPPPQKLFRQFEAGEITREELQAVCALHQREMLAEIEELRLNPVAGYIEELLVRREAAKLRRLHGEGLVREVLQALAELTDFPPAILFWNAGHRDVSMHCFFRFRREPVFRILKMEQSGARVKLEVEYGAKERKKATREAFTLYRDAARKFSVSERRGLD
ncbi:MAG: hypothetical protein AAGC74_14650 [Verrucomicrobiota bacterium]